MNKFLLAIALVVALAVASPTVRAESGSEDCFVVRATSNARNQAISTDGHYTDFADTSQII